MKFLRVSNLNKGKSKFFIFFTYLIIYLFFDFILTNLFIKDTFFWKEINKKYFSNKNWRIESNLYHHDLAKNINVQENWGNFNYQLITNSLGFRDNIQKSIKLNKLKKERIYINGDSFLEGVGYNYEDTVAGLLSDKLSEKYEILNSAVVSYSPSIYYKKTKYYLNKGLKFNYCIVFLDISDIPDENFIDEDEKGNIYDIRQKKKERSFKGHLYRLLRLYRDNFISGKFFAVLRYTTGKYKKKIKNRILASKKFEKSIFDISQDDINLFRSTHIDRSMWTFDKKYSEKWQKKGLKKSSIYLKKLFDVLTEKNIESYLVIYPNPGQILFNKKNIHEDYWVQWSKDNDVHLINLYKYFLGDNRKDVIKKYFIDGDVHWNKEGNLLVFHSLENELFNNF